MESQKSSHQVGPAMNHRLGHTTALSTKDSQSETLERYFLARIATDPDARYMACEIFKSNSEIFPPPRFISEIIAARVT